MKKALVAYYHQGLAETGFEGRETFDGGRQLTMVAGKDDA